MEFLKQLIASVEITVLFSWLALISAAIMPGALKLIDRFEMRPWMYTPRGREAQKNVPVWIPAFIGGMAGAYVAVSSLALGEWWICKTQGRLCNDGQGGIALLFTLPALSFAGSAIALGWTWLTLKIPSRCLGASILIYDGRLRLLNWLLGLALAFAFWAAVTFILMKLSL
ncbi:MAG: hypothetical protein KGN79_03620 [Acidobacteriota bacterium]|nr:hypothetical protein [Acidobacteriota bacterium]